MSKRLHDDINKRLQKIDIDRYNQIREIFKIRNLSNLESNGNQK